jgi:hypothetical protein
VSEIYDNAVDSLRIGMEFFLKETNYSSRKHAILTVFHAIELLLKEQLSRTNQILIYKNIDAKITENAPTVGLRESLARLENLGLGIPKEEKETIENIQRIRNRIEHHRYVHKEAEDDAIIASSLKFILYFVEMVLQTKLEDHIDGEILRNINSRVLEYSERRGLADFRFEEWCRKMWPEWDQDVDDVPPEFPGTDYCPECRQAYLIIGYHDKPVCFFCNTTIDAANCEECGETFLMPRGCGCGTHKPADDGGKLDRLIAGIKVDMLREANGLSDSKESQEGFTSDNI